MSSNSSVPALTFAECEEQIRSLMVKQNLDLDVPENYIELKKNAAALYKSYREVEAVTATLPTTSPTPPPPIIHKTINSTTTLNCGDVNHLNVGSSASSHSKSQ
jgi:hypothetical protein